MQHAEVYDGHKHALTRIDTTFKKHNTNNANNKNVQLANKNIQLLQAFSKQKIPMKRVFDILSGWSVQRHSATTL